LTLNALTPVLKGPSEGFEPSSSGFFPAAPLGALVHSRLY
jgi:hypothetical protein